jgi:Skp family chaperone for outer membrane proteins
MEKWNLAIGIVVGALGASGTLFSLYLAPINLQLTAMNKKLEEIEASLEKVDDRQRRHTGDADKHVTQEWKADVAQRQRLIENAVFKIAAKLGVEV